MKGKQGGFYSLSLTGFHGEVHVFVHKDTSPPPLINTSFRYLKLLIHLQEQHNGESHPYFDSKTFDVLIEVNHRLLLHALFSFPL